MCPTTTCKNKSILILLVCKAKRNSQYICNCCYWYKNETFHNGFLKSEKDEFLVIDNLSLFQMDGVLWKKIGSISTLIYILLKVNTSSSSVSLPECQANVSSFAFNLLVYSWYTAHMSANVLWCRLMSSGFRGWAYAIQSNADYMACLSARQYTWYSGSLQPPAHLCPASVPDSMLESSTLRLIRYTPEMPATKGIGFLSKKCDARHQRLYWLLMQYVDSALDSDYNALVQCNSWRRGQ